ncbi:circularly permuted type 2 ATP-grasp protein [Pseudonocardia sp. CA-107938]|uniref:circularly permuted type 2 ATP-grasp protein n=1 Tax=Pseudonocardia sp. CA-107938 TaxID=3240021 RepID=UPI003D8D318E
MRAPDGSVRPLWTGVAALLDGPGLAALRSRRADTERLLADEGVAYRPPGADEPQAWQLDPLPLVLDGAEWTALARGIAQRAELADRLLADLYGPRTLLDRGLLPLELVDGHPGYLHNWRRPAGPARRELFLSGVELGRGPDGWTVLADRVQAPSGAGYAMAGRRVVSRALAGLHRRSGIRRLRPFFDAMRTGLPAAAPPGIDEPRVVLLHPGPDSETAYEQALLSSLLGIALVRGSELTVRGGRLWQHSLGGLDPVDVVLRRLDARWCDPLDLRPDSVLGVPGLVEAARVGTVSVLNGLGSEVLENPGLVPYLPGLCRALLGEDLQLPGPATWWCGDPAGRSHVLTHLAELVVAPIARELAEPVHGAELSAAERGELAARIAAEPHLWTAHVPPALSTAPVLDGDGVGARPVAVRTFAVASGSGWEVLDGGLGLVGEAGGVLAKDVWIVGEPAPPRPDRVAPSIAPSTPPLSPRVADDLFWLGRYAERAEAVARLLRAVDDRWADVVASPDRAVLVAMPTLLRAVAAVTGSGHSSLARRTDEMAAELRSLLCDRDRPGSLAFAVHRMTRAAQAVREQLSGDTWLVLGRLDTALAAVGESSERDALDEVLQGLLAWWGIVADSLVRDAGWHLLAAGRRVERAQQVVALLRAALVTSPRGAPGRLVSETVLIATESVITHRRRHPQDAAAGRGVATVLELLLTDTENPRAVAFQLAGLADDLARLPGRPPAAMATATGRLAALDVHQLSTRVADGSRPALDAALAGLEKALAELADEIAATHFAAALMPRPYDPLAGTA